MTKAETRDFTERQADVRDYKQWLLQEADND